MNNIPVVIFSGGTGTRLKEMTEFLPKPLIPVGGKPLIWHIMKIYSHFGHSDFVLALGYKQEQFKLFFRNYDIINRDVTIFTGLREVSRTVFHAPISEQWSVTLIDTGEKTLKEGRLKRLERFISEDVFMLCYGDSVADINIPALLDFHFAHKKMVTITGVFPVSKFGEIKYSNENTVIQFEEKPQKEGCLASAGFFVCNKEIFKWIKDDGISEFETTLKDIAAAGELMVYKHTGFFGCMDTLREMGELQDLWDNGKAKWKIWED